MSVRAERESPGYIEIRGLVDPTRMTDSLLFVYGMAAVRARDCSTAVPVFEGVIRRQREPAVADGAREGLGLCALVEGQRLVAAGKPADAEDWFRRATAPGAPSDVVRGAFLGLGDVKLALFMGLLLGWPYTFTAVFYGVVLAAVGAIVSILVSVMAMSFGTGSMSRSGAMSTASPAVTGVYVRRRAHTADEIYVPRSGDMSG